MTGPATSGPATSGPTRVPLTVLDLVPVVSGSDAPEALRRSTDLARRAEALGYARYWVAEHHLNPGVAGTAPAVVLALLGTVTTRIRLGSAAVLTGHRTALSVVEEFGLLDAAYPGRIDLGLGRSGGRHLPPGQGTRSTGQPSSPRPDGTPTDAGSAAGPPDEHGDRRAPNGLLLPAPFSSAALLSSPRFALQAALLQQPEARTPDYGDWVHDLLALLGDGLVSDDGVEARPVPGAGSAVQPWVLGSSPGRSAEVAGARGLRFGANYHVAPSAVLDAVAAYRSAFRPSPGLDRPHVSVSADVVVAEDDAAAAELATGFGLWVHSIRSGQGAIAFPTPEEARRHAWTDEERALVRDRVATQVVGSPDTVVARLEQLQEATGADELAITTITHDHAARVRSYELLADAWHG
ncbi:luciferase family oxidoreductase, group 1 [Nocardioides scoriae]|uniref:Luciferase family oxidoreductase, group 1 n=1 Tax=Nocardioides scoriae TaxID=642780 RepID=A0A1H1NZ96_9ACTN|nr:LLM class flavin-dependent oxidoreductase [Nocardioides scoriae]SDS04264.1 luciferase family oxidoreductase, group 1 [Nocardioides scoriae]